MQSKPGGAARWSRDSLGTLRGNNSAI